MTMSKPSCQRTPEHPVRIEEIGADCGSKGSQSATCLDFAGDMRLSARSLARFLAEAFDLALIGQLPIASLLGKVAVVEGFDLRFYLVNPRIDQLHLIHLR